MSSYCELKETALNIQAKETGIDADVFRFYLTYIRLESQYSAFQWKHLTLMTAAVKADLFLESRQSRYKDDALQTACL